MVIEKKTLRAGIRKEFSSPPPVISEAIRERLARLDCWRKACIVLSYHPLVGEIDLLPLLTSEEAKEWVFPRVDGNSLSLHRWEPDSSWVEGPYGIREPDPVRWPTISPDTVDLALVPALAFDRRGNRLGRGRGFYDRLLGLPGFKALRIGVSAERFLLPEIPAEPHDIRMDLVLTESSLHVPCSSGLDIGEERG